ncbi:MAG: DUF5995 family protein [Bacteroidota bacterium]
MQSLNPGNTEQSPLPQSASAGGQVQSFIQVDADSVTSLLEQLDRIVNWAKQQNSAIGFFPLFYQKIIRQVEAEISWGRFSEKALMGQLNRQLVSRFLTTLQAYFQGEVLPGAWQLVLTSTGNQQVSVFQHLMIGLQAHLLYDLPLSTSKVVGPESADPFEEDYFIYILLLVEAIEQVHKDLGRQSKTFKVMSTLGSSHDQWLAKVSRVATHRTAWEQAKKLSQLEGGGQVELIDKIDQQATQSIESIVSGAFKPRRRLMSKVSRWQNQPVSALIQELKNVLG